MMQTHDPFYPIVTILAMIVLAVGFHLINRRFPTVPTTKGLWAFIIASELLLVVMGAVAYFFGWRV